LYDDDDDHDDGVMICCSNVRVVAAGLSKAVKKLVRGRIPNLASYNDISDFVLRQVISLHHSLTLWNHILNVVLMLCLEHACRDCQL